MTPKYLIPLLAATMLFGAPKDVYTQTQNEIMKEIDKKVMQEFKQERRDYDKETSNLFEGYELRKIENPEKGIKHLYFIEASTGKYILLLYDTDGKKGVDGKIEFNPAKARSLEKKLTSLKIEELFKRAKNFEN